jgi:hypothetical protein
MRVINIAVSLLFVISAYSGNHYVRQGASGNGSDWTNAYGQLPAALVRGDTYYIGAGNYSGYVFDDTGSATITVKKATAADHGTETGWNPAYGTGQAVFGTLSFTQGYYTLDGNGTHTVPSDAAGDYGFKVSASTTDSWWGNISLAASHITLKYLHNYNTYHALNGAVSTVSVRFTGNGDYIKLQNCFFENSGKDGIQISGHHHVLVERCYIKRLGKLVDPAHGQTIQAFGGDDLVFRWNIWDSNEGESLLSMAWGNDNVRFYGNLVFVPYGQKSVTPGFNHSIVGDISEEPDEPGPLNLYVYHNTIVNIGGEYGGVCKMLLYKGRTGLYAYNNLFYHSGPMGWSGTWTAHDYSATGGGSVCGEVHEQTGLSASIFTNYTGNDFTLATATAAGKPLSSEPWWDTGSDPFFGYLDSESDMNGTTRGTGGGWDRGAYEFVTTNVECRTLNVECRIPLTTPNKHFDILGKLVPGMYTPGIYLVVPDDQNAITKITVLK